MVVKVTVFVTVLLRVSWEVYGAVRLTYTAGAVSVWSWADVQSAMAAETKVAPRRVPVTARAQLSSWQPPLSLAMTPAARTMEERIVNFMVDKEDGLYGGN